MSRSFILGLSTNEEGCPVCDLKPQAFCQTGVDDCIECGRCGLPSGCDLTAAPGARVPRPAATVAWLAVFRTYWTETGDKITAPELVGDDVELRGRMAKLNAWIAQRPELVAAANVATAAPYTSVSAIVVQIEGGDGEPVRRAWSLILPNNAIGVALTLPFDPALFALGTIVTIQTPFATAPQATRTIQ